MHRASLAPSSALRAESRAIVYRFPMPDLNRGNQENPANLPKLRCVLHMHLANGNLADNRPVILILADLDPVLRAVLDEVNSNI
jgi:hypothetical protein